MSRNSVVTPEQNPVPQEQDHHAIGVSTNNAARQNTVRNIGLVTAREYRNRVRQRSFIIGTIILLVMVIIAAMLPTIIQFFASRSGNSQTRLSIVNNAGSIGNYTGDTLTQFISTSLNGGTSTDTSTSTSNKGHFAINTEMSGDVPALQKKVQNGNLDMLLLIDRAANQDLRFTYNTNTPPAEDSNLVQIQTLTQQLSVLDRSARLGLTPQQTSSLFAPADFKAVNVTPTTDTRTAADRLAAYFIAYAGVFLIFMSVYLYGIGVAQGVAEEKGTRVMEVLINAATPFQLMCGKILGIGLAGLTQMAVLVFVGLGTLLLQGPLQNALLGHTTTGLTINITGLTSSLLLTVLLYFILGFLLYATLFAALGALVKRQDEVQNYVTPVTYLFMIGYFLSAFAGNSTTATWYKVLSFIPFWTPTMMLMRIGAGTVEAWEIALSVLIMIATIILCAIAAARIYRFGVLMYGQKPKFSQLAKLVSMK